MIKDVEKLSDKMVRIIDEDNSGFVSAHVYHVEDIARILARLYCTWPVFENEAHVRVSINGLEVMHQIVEVE